MRLYQVGVAILLLLIVYGSVLGSGRDGTRALALSGEIALVPFLGVGFLFRVMSKRGDDLITIPARRRRIVVRSGGLAIIVADGLVYGLTDNFGLTAATMEAGSVALVFFLYLCFQRKALPAPASSS